MNRRDLLCLSFSAAAVAVPMLTNAQPIMTAPVRITSTLPAGSGADAVIRMVAEKLSARWQQPVLVDPKSGGAGVVAINAMKNQPATGNDLLLADVGNLAINTLVFKNLRYDPERELTPVALVYRTPFFVVVSAEGKYKTVKDLMAAARQGRLNYGSNAVGGPLHVGGAQFASAVGAEMTHLAYKEASQLCADITSGQVDWAYGSIGSAEPLVKAGKLRLLAVADRIRSPAIPDIPTLEEAGGPKDVDAGAWVALIAPAGTPAAVVGEINRSVNDALSMRDVKDRMATFGYVIQTGPAQQVADMMRADRARYAEVIKRLKVFAGLKMQRRKMRTAYENEQPQLASG